jgi:GntP family gluconate:H+ symporter
VLLAGAIVLMRHRFFRTAGDQDTVPLPVTAAETGGNPRAWCPLIAMAVAMAAGILALSLSPPALIQLVMLAGVITALSLAPEEVRASAFSAGAKHAGVIIFDLCGAGALGAVIGASSLGAEAYGAIAPVLPAVVVPFLLAALIQTAQGSRVVTAVVTGGIIAGSSVAASIHPVPLILLISGGACIVSYVTDPYFWLVQRATGDDVAGVVRNYTVPLAAFGLAMAAIGAAIELFVL